MGVFVIVRTSEVGDEVVVGEACGPVAGVAVEEGEERCRGAGQSGCSTAPRGPGWPA
jgi:hypothetical protein